MEVIEKEMYHFNRANSRKDIWQVGNIFEMQEDFISDFYNRAFHFKPVVNTSSGELQAFSRIIDDYLEEEQEKETYINMLKDASILLKGFSLQKQELILEQARKEINSELPSRKNSIWLCDEKGMEFWKQELNKKDSFMKLFKVNVTGNLFKTSDIYIPNNDTDIIEAYEQAKKYWNPDYNNLDEERVEYLFNGKVKVLEKIDIR